MCNLYFCLHLSQFLTDFQNSFFLWKLMKIAIWKWVCNFTLCTPASIAPADYFLIQKPQNTRSRCAQNWLLHNAITKSFLFFDQKYLNSNINPSFTTLQCSLPLISREENPPVGHLMIPLLNWWLIYTHNNGFTASSLTSDEWNWFRETSSDLAQQLFACVLTKIKSLWVLS